MYISLFQVLLFNLHITAVPKITENSYSTILWRSRGARSYNSSLGAEPPAGSRGRAPGQGVKGQSLPEAENFLKYWTSNKMGK